MTLLHPSRRRTAAASCLLVLPLVAAAQTQPQQVTTPPKAQAWIDSATFSGLGMPAGGNPMAMLGGLFGGGGGKNTFGQTQAMSAGRWVDATLMARPNPQMSEGTWAVPTGFMAPALKMQAPQEVRQPVTPDEPEDKVIERDVERPRGRLLMYWGCGATVRSGQPQVLDFANAQMGDIQRFFVSRGATGRGAHQSPGRPVWPSPVDPRMVPAQGSLVGEHQFSGTGVVENFRFQIPPAQDMMPALALQQRESAGATELSWNAVPHARAYFAAAMGGGSGQDEMVLWTSSEVPETGMRLIDYQTNASVDRWVREKVLMPNTTTQCTVPAGIFRGQGAMLRLIGYGSELNLAFPPRPTDPRQRWDPDWAVKVRVKTVVAAMLGMPEAGTPERRRGDEARPGDAPKDPASSQTPPKEQAQKDAPPKPLEILRGILGR